MKHLAAAIFLIAFSIPFIMDIPASSDPTDRYVIERQGVNHHNKPELSSGKITRIPYATKVKFIWEQPNTISISGKKGKWTKVEYNNRFGWVFGGFLSKDQPK